MKSVLIGAIAGVAAVSGSAYIYFSNEFDQGIRDSIEQFNADAENDFTITYEDLNTSLFGGAVSAKDIRVASKNVGDTVLHIGSFNAGIDIWDGLDTRLVQSGKASEISLSTPKGIFSLFSIEVQDLRLGEAIDQINNKEFTSIPLTMFELTGLDAKMNSTAEEIKTDSILFKTSDGGTKLDEFHYSGVTLNVPATSVSMSLGNFQINGGDLDWINDFVWLANKRDTNDTFHDARAREIAQKMAIQSMNYMGVESFEVKDFNLTGPAEVSMSIKDLYVKDLVREKEMVVAAKAGITDFSILNMKNIPMEANQFLTLADYNDFNLNIHGESKFNASTGEMNTDSIIEIDELFKLSNDFTMSGVDLAKMRTALLPLQEKQFEQMFTELSASEQTTPEAELAKAMGDMIDTLKAAYVGYYTGFETSLKLEDIGLNDKLLKYYSVSTGAGRSQLRKNFNDLTRISLAPLFGSSKPANMDQAIASYFAPESSPFGLSFTTKQTFTAETFDHVTAENWHELFDIAVSQTPAQ